MAPIRRAVSIRTFALFLVPLFVLSTLTACGRKKGGAEVPTLTLFYNAEEQPTEKNAISQLLQSQLQQHEIPVRLDSVSNTIFTGTTPTPSSSATTQRCSPLTSSISPDRSVLASRA